MINIVNLLFFEKLFFNLAIIGFSNEKFKDLKINGKTKNLKHAAVDIGLPGNPKKHLLFTNLAKSNGLPGLIATPLKIFFNLNFLIKVGIKSNFPAETAPEVIIISILEFIFFLISFLKKLILLSFITFFILKFTGKFFTNESK